MTAFPSRSTSAAPSRFAVYEVEHDEIQAEELRGNIGTVDGEGDCEAHHAYQNRVHDYGQMIAALEDCRVVLCRGMGVRRGRLGTPRH